jgi:selenocysteine lyase/cysteine desulfurase
LDERTRIVSLSAANFLSGYPLDLATIGKFLHERGILFCVDGIQMLGAVPVDVSEADFLCADSHKWLLGPNGAAVLWVRPTVLKQLRPAVLGWLATEEREDWFKYGTAPRRNADCFEPGARNYLGIVGFEASLALFEEAGLENVAARVSHLRDYTAAKLEAAGCRLLWKPEPSKPSGIVSFQKPGADTTALYKKIDERFAISIRQYRDGELWLRVSPHFMNCEADIDELLALIEEA